jgi:sterol desaturase/sphingolipid hydroxylase (fatty acid hydroxylase superfamily)
MELIASTKLILGTFSASTFTAYLICNQYNIPFFNPKHNRYQFYYNLRQVSLSTSYTLLQAILISSFFIKFFIDKHPHSIMQSTTNLIKYSVFAELLYYIYHRTVHKKQYYKQIHSMHHENVEVYPIDTFYMTNLDSFFLVGSLGAPVLFLNLNYYELAFSTYVYITAAYLEHSRHCIISHHDTHHKLIFCNYCILNPIFDIIFRTYR